MLQLELTSPSSDAQWREYYAFRWQILRAPWNQPPGSERDEYEAQAWHVMAIWAGNQICGVGRLHRVDEQCGQIRYMAVTESRRGQGIGTAILAALEQQARRWRLQEIVLNARDTALNFYLAQGYVVFDKGDTLFGTISHSRMRKML